MSGVEQEAAAPVPPKSDPESLAIRARPARAIRFRRGVIIGIAAIGTVGLTGVAWMALQPQVFRQVAVESDLSDPGAKPATDTLSKLPESYGDTPKLGPPLPGDLGRPILKAQQAHAMPVDTSAADAASRAEAERQQREAALKAARESGLMVGLAGKPVAAAAPTPIASDGPAGGTTAPPDQRDPKTRFAETTDPRGDINPHMLGKAPSPYMLMAGSVISASLITGLNSDMPGIVTAQVTSHVYDTVTGRTLLIPQGARLIGKYDNVVAFGQRRALVVWQRLILPDGSSLRIDNAPTTDAAGYAGLADRVDFHTWSLLKGIGMATLLGVGTELSISGESDLVQAIRQSAQSNTARAGDQITQRNLDIPPMITIRPGAPVRLVVHKDLVLAPWQG